MSRKLPLIASFLALFSLSVPVMAQRTTGNIVGVVSDETGAILPGVTVTIAGQYLMASQTATSTASGRYRFPNLPPGPYTLTFSLTGFASLTRSDLRLETGATLEVNVVLKLSQVAESVTVTGEQPVVDVRSSEISTNYDREWVENAPLPRFTFFDLINAAPGISQNDSQDSRSTALGSGTDENSYMLDGTDFTSPFTGAAWPWPNTDAIAEVEVLSLGAPAEYGNLSGAVFNITTRQGSNDFHGDVNYYYQSEGLTASNTTPAQDDGFPFNRDFYNDFTAQVGGPIIKDRLWFFGSYQHQEDSSTQPGVNPDFPTLTESDRMFVKVNYQINDNHRLLFALHNDWYFLPGEQNANTAPTTVGVESGNNPSPNLTYTGIFSANTLVEARFSGFYGTDHGDPIVEGEPRVKPRFYNLDTGQITGGVYYWYDSNVFKTGVSGKVSHYADQFLGGSHDFKFGAQYSRGGVDNGAYGANDFIYTYEYYGEPYAYGYSYDAFGYGGIAETIGVFVDDSWAVNDRLTLNLGLSYDHKVASVPELSVPDAAGNLTGATFPARDLYTWNTISPRLGFNLRLTTDGKTALKGHWGRYYRGIVTGEFVYELGLTPASTFAGSYDLATQQFTSLEEFESSLNKGVDPDYSNPYTDQFIIGFERELTTNWGFSANYVHKRGRNNAAWSATGEYEEITYIDDQGTDATGNPITVLALVSDPGDRFFTIGNDDRMSTDVNAVTITLRKRMSDRWQMTNSLVFMKTSGRLPSSIDSFGRQNASLVFSDFGQNPNDFINTDGRLVNDRPVEFKTSLVYEFPFNLMLAAGWRLQSGKPWARTVRPEGTGLVTEILAEQIDGSRRVSTWNLLDLRAQYAIELGGGTNVAFFGDVFNLFNEDANEEVLSTLGTSESFDFPSFFVLPRRLMLGAKFRF